MDYHFKDELPEAAQQAELSTMIQRSNHQSVKEDSTKVAKLLSKEVLHGFSLPISPKIVPNIAHVMVQPAGVVKQFLLQEDEARTLKR
jgi:hypothetical protein